MRCGADQWDQERPIPPVRGSGFGNAYLLTRKDQIGAPDYWLGHLHFAAPAPLALPAMRRSGRQVSSKL